MHRDKLKHNYHKTDYHDHDHRWKMMHHSHYSIRMKVNHQQWRYSNEMQIFVIYNFHFHYRLQMFHIQRFEMEHSKVLNQSED
jgi:hypothetical protein